MNPKQQLEEAEIISLNGRLLETVNWTVSSDGVASCLDRGYTSNSVASGLLGDLLEQIDAEGLDITKVIADALIMHDAYGRRQAEKARKIVGAIAPLIEDSFTRRHAEMMR